MDNTIEQILDSFLDKITNFFVPETWLILSPALISILYAASKQFGILDWLTGRKLVVQGLERLKNPAGFPISWIHSDKIEDEAIFKELYKRIKKYSKNQEIQYVLTIPHKPTLIATAGQPMPILDVDPKWPQSAKYFYSENHPVLLIFEFKKQYLIPCQNNEVSITLHFEIRDEIFQKAVRVCTLKDLDDWLKREKEQLDFWLGSIIIGILSIILIIIRLAIINSN